MTKLKAAQPRDMLTPPQLAERWDVSTGTLENWRVQKRGPVYVKLGAGRQAKVLYPMDAITEYERTHTVQFKTEENHETNNGTENVPASDGSRPGPTRRVRAHARISVSPRGRRSRPVR